ncbi:MAG: ATP synthase F1 subunit epsilon [Saprospiraceae bacterium]|jgi:F-type H+-transporting ATPase subunit epsilon
MHISVLTPDRSVFDGEARSVKVPGSSGEFEVLDNHAPIVSALDAGRVVIRPAHGEAISFHIEKGFIEVLNNTISLLVQGYSEVPTA